METFEEHIEHDFESIRKAIMAKTTEYVSAPSTIREIKERVKQFKIHVIGKFDKKGIVEKSSTRYAVTTKVTGILYDETDEIKVRLWGEISKEISNGDILELDKAYCKNGILNNKQGGIEVIHKI